MRLSPNFELADLTRSDTARRLGLPNDPPAEHLANLGRLAEALEAVQALLRRPLTVNSAYRSPAVNAAVGGVPTSRHALGLAADFTCAGFGPPLEVARAIARSGIAYDQVIHEYGRWVHLGLAAGNTPPRRQALTICSAERGYEDGLLPCSAAAGRP